MPESESFVAPELLMLRLFCRDKENVLTYQNICDKLAIDAEIEIIYKNIKDYYSKYISHIYLSKEELKGSLLLEYSAYKNIGILVALVDKIFDLDVSDSICKDVVNGLVEKEYATKIIQKLLPTVSENKNGVLQSIEQDLLEFKNYTERQASSEIFVKTSLRTLLDTYRPSIGSGLSWKLTSLQEVLGPITPGIFIHLVSRPESGKTSFLADEMVHIADQLSDGQCILWCNNEEAGDRIQLRLHSVLMDMDTYELSENWVEAESAYRQVIGDKIRLIEDKHAAMTVEQLRQYCKEYKPTILIVDHADKLTFAGSRHMDIPVRLRELYNKYRAIGKEYGCTVIAVGHTSTESEGKKWVTMDHLDYSKTGKAAEVDTIIGIGKTHNEEEDTTRFLSFPKNKLTGNHAKLTVNFNHKTGTYSDI